MDRPTTLPILSRALDASKTAMSTGAIDRQVKRVQRGGAREEREGEERRYVMRGEER